MYFLELHIHTLLGSNDSFLELDELIDHVKKNKVNGIAITEHFDMCNCSIDNYEKCYSSYNILCDMNVAFDIIPGMEIKLKSGYEFLIYGLKIPYDICCLSWDSIKKYVRNKKGLIIKAHPYRDGNYNWSNDCDGIEVYNSLSTHYCNNRAEKYFVRDPMYYIIGSDAHFDYDLGKAILVLDIPLRKYSNMELINAIKKNAIGGIINGKFKSIKSLHM